MEVQFYKVKVIDAAFRARHGEFIHLTLDKANRWEKLGRGKIVGPVTLGVAEPLTAKELLPEAREGGYVTKEEGPRRFEDGD